MHCDGLQPSHNRLDYMFRLPNPYGHSWQQIPHKAQSKIPLPFLPTQQVSSTSSHHGSTYPVVLPCPAKAQKCRQGNREWADRFSPSPLLPQVLNSPSFPAWTMMLFSLHWSPCSHFCSHFNSFSSQQQEWVFWNKSDHAVVGIWFSNGFPFPKE